MSFCDNNVNVISVLLNRKLFKLLGEIPMQNVFEAILETGHDEDFIPVVTDEFCPTDAPAGSPAKLEVLAERIRKGLPLWHPEDRVDYTGLTGTVRPRE
jgi:hypothetical protein